MTGCKAHEFNNERHMGNGKVHLYRQVRVMSTHISCPKSYKEYIFTGVNAHPVPVCTLLCKNVHGGNCGRTTRKVLFLMWVNPECTILSTDSEVFKLCAMRALNTPPPWVFTATNSVKFAAPSPTHFEAKELCGAQRGGRTPRTLQYKQNRKNCESLTPNWSSIILLRFIQHSVLDKPEPTRGWQCKKLMTRLFQGRVRWTRPPKTAPSYMSRRRLSQLQ